MTGIVAIFSLILLCCMMTECRPRLTGGGGTPRALILVDGINTLTSELAQEYCFENDIQLVDLISPMMQRVFAERGQLIEERLCTPTTDSVETWLDTLNDQIDYKCISESEFGVESAQLLSGLLGSLPRNAPGEALLDRWAVQLRTRSSLPAVAQDKASTWKEAESILNRLWLQQDQPRCIMKSRIVRPFQRSFLCHSIPSAMKAFETLGGDVIIQEFQEGVEYRVETVGNKVMAVWRKSGSNLQAPQFEELVPADTSEVVGVCQYCLQALAAQPLVSGPAVTVVRVAPRCQSLATSPEPESPEEVTKRCRLISLRAKWSSRETARVCRQCVGYDAVTATLDEAFAPAKFAALPSLPLFLRKRARIFHLHSARTGVVRGVRFMDCLQSLPSLQALRLRYGIGEILPRSMDTATMAGWAVLMHEDAEVLETDCEVLRSLQYQVLDVDPTDQTDESTSSAEGIGEPLLASTDIFLFNRSLLFGAPAAGRRKVWLWAQRTAHCTAAVAAASFLCAATLAPALRGLLLRF